MRSGSRYPARRDGAVDRGGSDRRRAPRLISFPAPCLGRCGLHLLCGTSISWDRSTVDGLHSGDSGSCCGLGRTPRQGLDHDGDFERAESGSPPWFHLPSVSLVQRHGIIVFGRAKSGW
eukprot:scaffold58902_cov28-Tisochrysis_lutea.AAC.1